MNQSGDTRTHFDVSYLTLLCPVITTMMALYLCRSYLYSSVSQFCFLDIIGYSRFTISHAPGAYPRFVDQVRVEGIYLPKEIAELRIQDREPSVTNFMKSRLRPCNPAETK